MNRLFLSLGITSLSLSITSANLISNGSFESPGHTGPYVAVSTTVNPTFVTGWWATENGFDYHNEDHFGPAYDGDFMIDLNAASAKGGISQTFPTVIGQTYLLSFAMAAPDAVGFQNPRELIVKVGSLLEYFYQPASAAGTLEWGLKSLSFTATGSSTTLEFVGNTTGNYWGPVIDDVSVVATPDGTATLSLLALAVASLGTLRARRSKL